MWIFEHIGMPELSKRKMDLRYIRKTRTEKGMSCSDVLMIESILKKNGWSNTVTQSAMQDTQLK